MDSFKILSALRLENGKRWGEAAEPFQVEDAKAILEGKTRRHYLTRPRGGSKTSDLAGCIIALMLGEAPRGSRSYGIATDREQAGLLMDAIAGFLSRTPEVRGALETESWKVRNANTDATFLIASSDEASAWGWRPWLIIIDELANWPETRGPKVLWRAAISSLPKVPGSRLVVLTSAGSPGHWSHDILTQVVADEAWRVHQVPGPVPWLSEEDLAEQERLLTEWEYRRLILNEWATADDRLTNYDDVQACLTLLGPQPPHSKERYVIGLDLGVVRDRSVASVCHLADDTVVLDTQEVWEGDHANPVQLQQVEDWLYDTSRRYNRARIVFDPRFAKQIEQRLSARKVRLIEYTFSQQSVGRLAVNLHQLLRNHKLALYEDPGLIDELLNVTLEERGPGNYRIDHHSSRHDDRVISLALAAEHLISKTAKPKFSHKDLAKAMGAANLELSKPSLRL